MTDQDRYHFRLYMQSRWEDRHPDLRQEHQVDYSNLIVLVFSLITIVANGLILMEVLR